MIAPGKLGEGDWVPFYSVERDGRHYKAAYDRTRLDRRGSHVVGRWKVVRGSDGSMTLYVIDIDCARATFTEKGTVLIDADGRQETLKPAELLTNDPIARGTSADKFRRMFCR